MTIKERLMQVGKTRSQSSATFLIAMLFGIFQRTIGKITIRDDPLVSKN